MILSRSETHDQSQIPSAACVDDVVDCCFRGHRRARACEDGLGPGGEGRRGRRSDRGIRLAEDRGTLQEGQVLRCGAGPCAEGGPVKLQLTTSVAFERPNKLALHSKGAMQQAIDVVSNGKTVFMSVPSMKKYIEAEAPATLEELLKDPLGTAAVQFTLMAELSAADPYEKLMQGVTSTSYAGLETIDGAKAHHLKFVQDQFDWELWTAAEGDPLVLRVVNDLTKSVANSPMAAQLKGQKLEMVQDFKGWKIDRGVDEKSFAFEPPAGSQEVRTSWKCSVVPAVVVAAELPRRRCWASRRPTSV